jgi:uncharacterized membrane protein
VLLLCERTFQEKINKMHTAHRSVVVVAEEQTALKPIVRYSLPLLSIILFICAIGSLAGGRSIYSADSNSSNACNFGFAGIILLICSPLGLLPIIFKNKSKILMKWVTWTAALLSVCMLLVWIALAHYPTTFHFDEAKPGYYLTADVELKRVQVGNCYNG